MDHLPDDVLLMVMQYLDVKDLINCRLMCKRLAGLALHPDVWRHRRIFSSSSKYHSDLACPALKLAPCLAELEIDLRDGDSDSQLHELYTTTRCAVSTLKLMVYPKYAAAAALVVSKQEALGRLRHLVLIMHNFKNDHNLFVLLAAAASVTGLQSLDVCAGPDIEPEFQCLPDLHISAPEPSLKRLRSDLQPFVNYILAAHAATLEVVVLKTTELFKSSTATATLLAALPNLRSLECGHDLPGLQDVAACESLSEAHLYMSFHGVDYNVSGLAGFLREAKQLRAVTLKYCCRWCTRHAGAKNLPLALARPGRQSILESLVIEDRFNDRTKNKWQKIYLQPLIAALPALPMLRHLEVNVVMLKELAGRVTRLTAPALQTLRLAGFRDDQCAHWYLHSASVKSLLADNPGTEISVWVIVYNCYSSGCKLCTLKLRCHKLRNRRDSAWQQNGIKPVWFTWDRKSFIFRIKRVIG